MGQGSRLSLAVKSPLPNYFCAMREPRPQQCAYKPLSDRLVRLLLFYFFFFHPIFNMLKRTRSNNAAVVVDGGNAEEVHLDKKPATTASAAIAVGEQGVASSFAGDNVDTSIDLLCASDDDEDSSDEDDLYEFNCLVADPQVENSAWWGSVHQHFTYRAYTQADFDIASYAVAVRSLYREKHASAFVKMPIGEMFTINYNFSAYLENVSRHKCDVPSCGVAFVALIAQEFRNTCIKSFV